MANTWNQAGTTWGQNSWGQQADVTLTLTSLPITSSLGTLAYAQSVEGWGRDTWGSNQWGEDAVDVSLTGLEMTAGMGPTSWGADVWGESTWGGDFVLSTTQLTVAALTGIEATGSVGTPILNYDFLLDLTGLGPAQIGAGLGTLSINDGADHSQGLGSLLATGSVGSLSHEMTYELGSLSITGSVGAITITSAKLVIITATNLATGSVGSLTVDDMSVGLTGLQATGSVGSLTVDDMSIGLSGLEMTGALGIISPLHYRNDTITGSTSYTSVDITGSTSYTIDEHAA